MPTYHSAKTRRFPEACRWAYTHLVCCLLPPQLMVAGGALCLAHFGVSVLGPPGKSSLGLIQVTLGTWAKEGLSHKIFLE